MSPEFVSVIVSNAAGKSAPASIRLGAASALLSADGSGCGAGMVFRDKGNGVLELITHESSAQPGDAIVIFGTGFSSGNASVPADGFPAASFPPPDLGLDTSSFVLDRALVYMRSFLSTQFPGIDEIHGRIPIDTAEGCAVPLHVSLRGGGIGRPLNLSQTQIVGLSIRRGGGACLDVVDTIAHVSLVKTTFSGFSQPPPSDRALAMVTASVGNRKPEENLPDLGPCHCSDQYDHPAPFSCGGFMEYQRRLLIPDSGRVDELSAAVSAISADSAAYEVVLPPGLLGAGQHAAVFHVPEIVGNLGGSVLLPEPVQITSTFPPGSTLGSALSIPISWTGGDPYGFLKILFKQSFQSGSLPRTRVCTCWAPIATHTFTFFPDRKFGGDIFLFDSTGGEIQILQSPLAPTYSFLSEAQSIGTYFDYQYRYIFQDLNFSGLY